MVITLLLFGAAIGSAITILFGAKPYNPTAEKLLEDAYWGYQIKAAYNLQDPVINSALKDIADRNIKWSDKVLSGLHYDTLFAHAKTWHGLSETEKRKVYRSSWLNDDTNLYAG